jgi:hypothetical protein
MLESINVCWSVFWTEKEECFFVLCFSSSLKLSLSIAI